MTVERFKIDGVTLAGLESNSPLRIVKLNEDECIAVGPRGQGSADSNVAHAIDDKIIPYGAFEGPIGELDRAKLVE
jgi:hypothetical protein